jgi:hypothetical protein
LVKFHPAALDAMIPIRMLRNFLTVSRTTCQVNSF